MILENVIIFFFIVPQARCSTGTSMEMTLWCLPLENPGKGIVEYSWNTCAKEVPQYPIT